MPLNRSNLRASLWAVLYSFLIVVGCGSMIEADISPFTVVPIGLFAVPLIASVPYRSGEGARVR